MRHLLRMLLTTTLLIVSVLPIVFAFQVVSDEYVDYAAFYVHRDPLPVPTVEASASPGSRNAIEVPPFEGEIPVLQYHGINEKHDLYSVSQESFAEHMQALAGAGFETIGIRDFVAAMRGEDVELPPRPVLITFDDGRLDSYRGAHEVLESHGFSAVMFAISSRGESPFYLSWDELRKMDESPTWEVQMHAHEGHDNIPVSESEEGPYYANLIQTDRGLETIEHYKRRVAGDIAAGLEIFEEELEDFEPVGFAVPYGNAGEDGSNDDRIASYLHRLLRARFDVVFGENSKRFATPNDLPSFSRIEMYTHHTADQLLRWLSMGAARTETLLP
jgi:peptidoglycan/xylan/chitin deacetylase (PgdA/CDA1 family)